ncbi:helicase [bacterium]|nr:helicase [bacterium]
MSGQFITNQDELLTEVINGILPTTDKTYFLVGYFYFSGFEALCEKLADKKMQILVGLDIEKNLHHKMMEVEFIQGSTLTRGQIKTNFYDNFSKFFNDTDFFDSEERIRSFKLFVSKIKDGTLEIRKTKFPNHAKLYLFEKKAELSEGGNYPGAMITGSSNLSISGLQGRHEANILDRDKDMYEKGMKFFMHLWENESVEIAGPSNHDFFNKVIEKIWIDKLPKPFLLYVRVLHELFHFGQVSGIKLPSEISKNKIFDLKYQTDAILQAMKTLERHNGVIIADVVGLGKSIIASAIAHNLKMKTVIIAPPHLMYQWDDYRYNIFNFQGKVHSRGAIEKALIENDDGEQKLIIIDEAHTYRNELTKDYADLHRLCQGNKVILLTATPFNNRPQDILAMIKLFQIPSRSTIQTVDNLSYQFRELVKEYKDIKKSQKEKRETATVIDNRIKLLAKEIRDIISPLVIRRSRLDLDEIKEYKDDLKKQGISFPAVRDPKVLEYELGKLSQLYVETLERIAPEDESKGFIGARYKPTSYLIDAQAYKAQLDDEFGDKNLFIQAQVNLAKFMRRLLVHRFESSVFAFERTLKSMIQSSQHIKDWYIKLGRIPIYKKGALPDVDALLTSLNDKPDVTLEEYDFEEELKAYKEKGLQIIHHKDLKPEFIKEVEKDIALLKSIYKEWFADGRREDPKLKSFLKIIKNQVKNDHDRKIVVFTEYSDTAGYLYDQLKDTIRVFKYSSDDANDTNKTIIRENFDAGAAIQKDDYDVLIATDAISEGFNLHRAGTVFNYDIPYNPTRVIQRVGRINRVNKKVFDELYIYNFFPTAIGEKETRIKEISTLKIAMIHALMGEDTKVLTSDEELRSFYRERFERIDFTEERSWDTKYRNDLGRISRQNPEFLDQSLAIPPRVRIRRTDSKDKKGVLIYAKKRDEHVFKFADSDTECMTLNAEEALKLFEADLSESPVEVSKRFYAIYSFMQKNLFIRKSQVAMDKGKQDAIHKLNGIAPKLPEEKDYFDDLLHVVQKLDSLPEYVLKQIRGISEKKLQEHVQTLKQMAPHEYLTRIIAASQQIEEGKEELIFSEEFV